MFFFSNICSRYSLCRLSRALFSSNVVPRFPQWNEFKDDDLPPARTFTNKEIEQLESISLVQYKNTAVEKALLEETLRFADALQLIDAGNVEPMFHINEDESLYLRQDKVTDIGCAKSILKNAKVVEEGYFVAPPGNITFYESKDGDD